MWNFHDIMGGQNFTKLVFILNLYMKLNILILINIKSYVFIQINIIDKILNYSEEYRNYYKQSYDTF